MDGYSCQQTASDLTDDKQVALFRAAAFDGDYGSKLSTASHFTKKVIPSFRFGRASLTHLQWLNNTATRSK